MHITNKLGLPQVLVRACENQRKPKADSLSCTELRNQLIYNDKEGNFYWNKVGLFGKKAGHINKLGYISIRVNGKLYQAHRLVFLYLTGNFPVGFVDHINGDGADNRIQNLRECNHSENHQNRNAKRNNPTGLMGVTHRTHCDLWMARIWVNNKQIYIGDFKTPELAHEAYLMAKQKYHKFQPTMRGVL